MSNVGTQLRALATHLARTAVSLSPLYYIGVACIAVVAVHGGDFYLMEVLVLVILYAQFAASWDVLCGYSAQDNFGHAFFIGCAGYLAAMLHGWIGISSWFTVPLAAAGAALMGLGIGWLTLRLRGPYFALSTIAFAAMLFELTFIFSEVTGGEEGISGISPFTSGVATDLLTCLVIFLISTICMTAFVRSHYGLILRSTQHNEDAAQASGLNTAWYKVMAFVVSGFFAGVGGSMYSHTYMQVNPELLAGSLSVLIVLLAVAGGRGTIVGPVFAAAGLMLLNEWLRIIEDYRPVLFTGTLIILVYLNPSGMANARILLRWPRLRHFLFGRR
jgi:branched-chain amino acid transport system permease protein